MKKCISILCSLAIMISFAACDKSAESMESSQNSVSETIEETTKKVTETQTEKPTEKKTEPPTEATTEKETESTTKTPTEIITEPPTEISTELFTEDQVEVTVTDAPAVEQYDNDEQSITVYYTKSGKKYHYENPCGKGTYYPCTLEEAEEKGLEPCEKCVLH